MTTETVTEIARPLNDLARCINYEHALALDTARSALEHARKAGTLLLAAKAQVPHGSWLPWLAEHCDVAPRVAQGYMRLADRWPELEANTKRASHLPLRDALALLSSPRAPIEADDSTRDDLAIDAELRLLRRLLDAPDLSIEELSAIIRRATELEDAAGVVRLRGMAALGRGLTKLEAFGGPALVEAWRADPDAFRQACDERIAELNS